MDKLEYYRHLIQKVLTEYYELGAKSTNSTLENALIFDQQHDHYLLMVIGWQGEERIKANTLISGLTRASKRANGSDLVVLVIQNTIHLIYLLYTAKCRMSR